MRDKHVNKKPRKLLVYAAKFGGQGGIRTHEPLARLPDFEFYWVTNLFVYFRGSFVSSRSSRKPAWLLTFSEQVPKTQ